jgi:putative DNA primase/helicase
MPEVGEAGGRHLSGRRSDGGRCLGNPRLVHDSLAVNPEGAAICRPGGCGRSRFLNGLRAFLGGARNVAALTLEAIEHDRFAAAGLVGKLANICPDLPPTRLRGCSTFKRITHGKDPVRVERKFYQSYNAQLFARLAFSANIKPQSEDSSDAFFQRWHVVEFTRVYRHTDEEIGSATIDAWLAEPNELSGVLNRALTALPKVIEQQGITITPSMRAAHTEFQKLTDPLSIWLLQNAFESPTAMVGRTEFLEAFNAAQSAEGRHPMSATEFGRALNTLRPEMDPEI